MNKISILEIILIISVIINVWFIASKLKHKRKMEDIVLTFYKGETGKIIARNKEGKICLPDIPYCRKNKIYLQAGEDWRCVITSEKPSVLIVQPVNRVLTAKENEKLFEIKAEELKDKYEREKKEVRAAGKPLNLRDARTKPEKT